MKENIAKAYSLTASEKRTIKASFVTHNDWDKDIFQSIKDNIITHLRIEQDNECCYCKRQLGYDIKNVDIEHIIPKSKFPKFTFHTKNLALSCPGCNTKKSFKCVLKKDTITNYPSNGSNFKIVHAHHDNYSSEIDLQDNCVYYAHTVKGSTTITMCELFRLKKVEENAKNSITKKSTIAQLMEELRTSDPSERAALYALLQV